MKNIITGVLLFFSSIANAVEIVPGRMSDAQREYRQGYTDGVAAGRIKGQALWSTLGCAAGGLGSVGGCYTCAFCFR